MRQIPVIWHILFLCALQWLVLDQFLTSSLIYITLLPLAFLILPFKMKPLLLLIIGFLFGMAGDLINGTPGLQAAAMTLLALCRPSILRTSARGEYINNKQNIYGMDTGWFSLYAFIALMLFFLALFVTDALSFRYFHYTLLRSLLSALFSLLLFLLYHALFFRSAKKK